MIDLDDPFAMGRQPKFPSRPTITMPRGAWDTHTHVIGPAADFPMVGDRRYTPPPASGSDLIAMMDSVGLQRAVVVQVSVHGADHSLLKQTLEAYPERLLGVAAINETTSDRELDALSQAGVVGSRVLDGLGGSVGMQALEAVAARCAEIGWHVQIACRANVIAATVDRLLKLPVPFVIDHMGWFSPGNGPDDKDFQTIAFLLKNAPCYLKLSGAFRMSGLPYPYPDVTPFARKLTEIAPDRCLWGSDWPHVGLADEKPMPDVGELLDAAYEYVAEPDLFEAILVDNPARLYGNRATGEGIRP